MTQAQTHAHEGFAAPLRPVRKRPMAVLRAFAMLVSILALILRRRLRASVRARHDLECHTDADARPAAQPSRDQQEISNAAASGETVRRRKTVSSPARSSHQPLIPAQAGIHLKQAHRCVWLPACAGMSGETGRHAKAPGPQRDSLSRVSAQDHRVSGIVSRPAIPRAHAQTAPA
jgi:hypothetical protein